MLPFHTPDKEHDSSRCSTPPRTQEQQLIFVQQEEDHQQLSSLSPIVYSPFLSSPTLDPGCGMAVQNTARINQNETNHTKLFSSYAGEPFIIFNEQERNNDYNKNSTSTKRIFNHYENDAFTRTNHSNDTADSTADSYSDNQEGTHAAQQLMNLQQYTPVTTKVSEYGWSTSSQMNTSVANSNQAFVSQEAPAKGATFFDSSYLDQAGQFPILNKRMKFSFSDKNHPCDFQHSTPDHEDENIISKKNSFEPLPLSHTTVRESKNHVSYLPTRRKDSLSDEDVKQFLQKMTAQQKNWVYQKLTDEIGNGYLQKGSHIQTGEEVKDSLDSTKLNLIDQMEKCAPVFPSLHDDHQDYSEENNTIDNYVDCKAIVKECSFRRGTERVEGRSYFRSLSPLAFQEKLNWIVQTIVKVSKQLHHGYIESDRKFLHRIWKIYQCYTRHCKCDWKIFVSKYGKVSHAKFECTCQETVDSDE